MKEHIDLKGRTAQELAQLYDSAAFENRFAYEGNDLGAVYTPTATTWKLWSPGAEAVVLCLYATGSDAEERAERIGRYPMLLKEKGVWEYRMSGDCRGVYYTYEVTAAGRTAEAADPYARAAGVNGRRSMIVDLARTNPEGWEEDTYAFEEPAERAFVWEVHVRDFSEEPDSGMQQKGRYLAFTEENTTRPGTDVPTGVAYLRRLGVTHVQLLPVFDFATVDEASAQPGYNWGYDPQNYSVPEGSYATDPYRGSVRIREFKEMVLALHRAGIGVIMDVVYNHTFETENSAFHTIMPFYYHRVWRDGSWANGSGCGNEIASERYMVRRMIVDSVLYWAREYHIDGFRFDLMGLMDLETINTVRRELDALPGRKNRLMYGEPWTALESSFRCGTRPADRSTLADWRAGIGYFNDEGRDGRKGRSFELRRPGFINAAPGCTPAVERMALGLPMASRLVQYVSCHDNYTLWDKLTATTPGDGSGYDAPELIRLAVNKIAAAAVFCAQGMPLIQAGEEFGRTRYGVGNAYISPIEINCLRWERQQPFGELLDYYRGLAALRCQWLVPTGETDRALRILASEDTWLVWSIRNSAGCVLVALNPGAEARLIEGQSGRWQVLADERNASAAPLREEDGEGLWVQARGVLIARRDEN